MEAVILKINISVMQLSTHMHMGWQNNGNFRHNLMIFMCESVQKFCSEQITFRYQTPYKGIIRVTFANKMHTD
jgi:hypothetical protein